MLKTRDLLIEIGTEELPPKSLKSLATAFSEQMCLALNEVELDLNDTSWYATPRRLSLLITDLDITQKDKNILSAYLKINFLNDTYIMINFLI